MNTPDEFAIVVSNREVDAARGWLMECMKTVPPWLKDCPIDCEVGIHERYGDC